MRIHHRIYEAQHARSNRTMKLVGRYHAANWFKGFGFTRRLLPKRPNGLGYWYRVQDWSQPLTDCQRCLTRPGPCRHHGGSRLRSAASHTLDRMHRSPPF